MAQATVKNIYKHPVSIPVPFNCTLPIGGSKTVFGVDLKDINDSQALNALLTKQYITLSIVQDPNLADQLQIPDISVFQYATEALLLADTPPAGVLGYAQDTKKHYLRAGTSWSAVVSGTGGSTPVSTLSSLTIKIDPASTCNPTAGEVTFTNQASVDAYLASKGATAFKDIMNVWDNALPFIIAHGISFSMVPGVHRPRTGETLTNAWDFTSRTDKPRFFAPGAWVTLQPSFTNYYVDAPSAPGVAGNPYTVASYALNSGAPYIQLSGAAFTPGALRGYFLVQANQPTQMWPIVENTADTIYLAYQYAGTPVTVRIVSPPVIMRNSWNDTSAARSSGTIYVGRCPVSFKGIDLQQFNATSALVGQSSCDFQYSTIDLARQVNDFGLSSMPSYIISLTPSSTYPASVAIGFAMSYSSIRGGQWATVPKSHGNDPFIFTGSSKDASTFYFSSVVIGGINRTALTCTSATMSMACTFIIGCYTAGVIKDSVLKWNSPQPALSILRQCTCGFSIESTNIQPSTSNDFKVDGCGTDAQSWILKLMEGATFLGNGYNETIGDHYGLTIRQGTNANTGIVAAIYGKNTQFLVGKDWDVAASAGDFLVGQDVNLSVIYSNLVTLAMVRNSRAARTQPSGNLLGAVWVDWVEPGTSLGASSNVDNKGTLYFVSAAKTLAYKAHGDSGAGATVDVTAGGIFQLKSTNGKAILVQVVAGSLPGADSTQTFQIQYGAIEFKGLGIRLIPASYW